MNFAEIYAYFFGAYTPKFVITCQIKFIVGILQVTVSSDLQTNSASKSSLVCFILDVFYSKKYTKIFVNIFRTIAEKKRQPMLKLEKNTLKICCRNKLLRLARNKAKYFDQFKFTEIFKL